MPRAGGVTVGASGRDNDASKSIASRLTLDNIGFLLAKASQRWNELLFERFVAAGFPEVRPAYGSLLIPLYEEDGLRQGELARRARLSKQTLTTMARALERDGLIERVPPVRGRVGRPRRRPERVLADRGYDHDKYRRELRQRRITPEIARRQTEHGSGLGRARWVVERTFAWLHHFKRLLIRYDRRHEIHEAFLAIGCCLVCFRRLQRSL